jgi:hypothetical protein
MNWKGCGRNQSYNLWYCSDICLERLRKTTEASVRIVGVLAEIQTENLPNKT